MFYPLVSIGLVTWNSAAKLPPTLQALARQDYPNLELIVVDNASADDSISLARQTFPAAQIILNAQNRGFCGGHNQAIAASRGKYYLPLNPDLVMRPDYITRLADVLEDHPECGSVAGKLLREPGIIDSTGLFINRRRQQYLRGHGEADKGQYDTPGEVFGVDGAGPLYRRAMLEDTRVFDQYFDENFFSHKEDVDLSWRSRLLGWRCWYTPTAIAVHERGFKPGQREEISSQTKLHAIKNRYLLLWKNELSSGWQRDWAYILWYDLQIWGYLCLFERSSLAALPLIGRLRPSLRAWRIEIMRRVKTHPLEMLMWFR